MNSNKYELVLIVDAQKSPNEKEDVVKQAADVLSKNDAKVINNQVWIEKRKLAFPIKKATEGTYYLVNFESGGAGLAKVRDNLKLNEEILRYAIIKQE